MFEEIQREIQRATEIAETYPEKYQQIVLEKLLEMLLRQGPPVRSAASSDRTNAAATSPRPTTIAEFANRLRPAPGTEHVVTAGFWLENFGGKATGFSSADLLECFRQMRYNPTNPHDPISRAKKSGLLIDQEGTLLLSNTALESMKAKMRELP